jgi:hypothetical protein
MSAEVDAAKSLEIFPSESLVANYTNYPVDGFLEQLY